MRRIGEKVLGGVITMIAGPLIAFASMFALYANETRFDYHRAATEATVMDSPGPEFVDERVAYTGAMDPSLVLSGEYVESFTGFLIVRRDAEIYAWSERQEDDRTVWDREWMDRLESNSRNSGLTQELSDRTFVPPLHRVGELEIGTDDLDFVDDQETISPATLRLLRPDLRIDGPHLRLSKGASDQIGDERIIYRAVPIPTLATWFGGWNGEAGVADVTEARSGFIRGIIDDTGLVHHLAAGDREVALATVKADFDSKKTTTRLVGTFVTVVGMVLFFGGAASLLAWIPIVGRLAGWAAIVLGVVIGLPLALLAILVGLIASNVWVLLGVFLVVAGLVALLIRRGRDGRATARDLVEAEHGGPLRSDEITEMEFLELVHLSMSDGTVDDAERERLHEWAKWHGWDDDRFEALLQGGIEASNAAGAGTDSDPRSHLVRLVRLSFSDGRITMQERREILRVAERAGYGDLPIQDLMRMAGVVPGQTVAPTPPPTASV